MTTEKPAAARKPGRPRKYEEGRHQASVRLTPHAYATVKKSADDNRRSISEELERRIEQSITADVFANTQRGLDEHILKSRDWAMEQLQTAIGQIKERDARNNELEARIDELLARIDALQREQALSEEAIERIVERAIGRAFAKIGEVK